jgi:hypothetical protein
MKDVDVVASCWISVAVAVVLGERTGTLFDDVADEDGSTRDLGPFLLGDAFLGAIGKKRT